MTILVSSNSHTHFAVKNQKMDNYHQFQAITLFIYLIYHLLYIFALPFSPALHSEWAQFSALYVITPINLKPMQNPRVFQDRVAPAIWWTNYAAFDNRAPARTRCIPANARATSSPQLKIDSAAALCWSSSFFWNAGKFFAEVHYLDDKKIYHSATLMKQSGRWAIEWLCVRTIRCLFCINSWWSVGDGLK